MTLLVAVDPGVDTHADGRAGKYGVAFGFPGVSVRASHMTSTEFRQRCQRGEFVGARLALEKPMAYNPKSSKGNPENIMRLRETCGRILEAAEWGGMIGADVWFPRDWKGTINGDMHNSRILTSSRQIPYVYAALEDIAAYPDSTRHNVIDALGLWLFASGAVSKSGDLVRR